jgi:hypothetical protein
MIRRSAFGGLSVLATLGVLAACSNDVTTAPSAARQATITAPADPFAADDNHKAFVCVVSPLGGTFTFSTTGAPTPGGGNPGPTIVASPTDVANGTCTHVATAGSGAGFPDPDTVHTDETVHPGAVTLSGVTVEQAVYSSQSGNFLSSSTAAGADPSTGIISNEQAVRIVYTYALTPVEGRGCTPGYWKQEHHFDSWVTYLPTQTLESVFDVPDALGMDNTTLVAALAGGGGPGVTGGAKILLRAAVAALLNTTSLSGYPLTTAQVISQVNTALASNNRNTMLTLATTLDNNNNLGCPLN